MTRNSPISVHKTDDRHYHAHNDVKVKEIPQKAW